jgi:hypothetical protein
MLTDYMTIITIKRKVKNEIYSFLQNFNNDEKSLPAISILPLIKIKICTKNRFDWLLTAIILHDHQYELYFTGHDTVFQMM